MWLSAVVVPLAAVGCAGETGDGFRVDDRERDAASCGTGDDNTSCPGAALFAIAGNPSAREFAVVWQGSYERTGLGAPVVYARRFDARTGKARGRSVTLPGVAAGYSLMVAHDPHTRTYAVAAQDAGAGGDAPLPPVRFQRFTHALRPVGSPLDLGSWALKALAVEPGGRVAVVGAENQRAINGGARPPGPPLRLRVETLDARDRSLRVERRPGPSPDTLFAGDTQAAYDPAARALLVSWTPLGPGSDEAIRVERVGPGRDGGVLSVPAPRLEPASGGSSLACNGARGDCAIVYPARTASRALLGDLYARRLEHGGRAAGPPVRIARGVRGTFGAAAHGAGYTVGWNEGLIQAPVRAHAVVARLSGAPARTQTLLDDELPGPAAMAGGAGTATDLLVWRPLSGDQGSAQLFGRILRVSDPPE